LEVRRAETIKQGTEMMGNRTKITVVKNKVAPPFRLAEVDIMYGEGISQVGELVEMGGDREIINKAGAWYSYGEGRIGQGRENAKTYFLDHPELRAEIEEKVRAAYGIGEPIEFEETEEKTEDIENLQL